MSDTSSNSSASSSETPRIPELDNAKRTPFVQYAKYNETAQDVFAGRVGLLDEHGRKITNAAEIRRIFVNKRKLAAQQIRREKEDNVRKNEK